MKKIITALLAATLCFTAVIASGCSSKNNEKTINVCASDVPHAEVLNGIVKSELKKEGYELKVTILDWTMQNDSVAEGDYDANYFQHVPYLETYKGSTKLFASCKVHYEPLGIYYGKAAKGTPVTSGKSFEICNDVSNAIRAFNLLEAKGVIVKADEGSNYPVKDNGEELNFEGNRWTSASSGVTVTLIPENLLVPSRNDYDFACLPCNTAYTGKVSSEQRADVESDPEQVVGRANVIAARLNDYKTNATYKAKIDALTKVMLSKAVSDYFEEKYLGSMICNETTQIDLRSTISTVA